ncbi:hypothetical protein [Arcobacter arenosus]|jgi:hypothetical protein|uniref:Uncharacterized protein n=1 Tax=Arcobacter arenosus TaxID=2576037 RepID=A0A5R8Y1M0_9BACT|nr:hypothetical protein [Arcobacter arenosus]TLP39143.1 hypothetical protein FDK22_04520 [Arcobacter arenosus]
MNRYVNVSNELYEVFEDAAVKHEECDIVYKDDKKQKELHSKVVDIKNVNLQEFIEMEDGTVIRLDKIVEFNGNQTKALNRYI